jgi:uncharacterized protein YceH (UPF0502 family)
VGAASDGVVLAAHFYLTLSLAAARLLFLATARLRCDSRRDPSASLRVGCRRHANRCAVEFSQHISPAVVSVNLLSDVEVRVLGALVEKDITTPDYYPLSLNALVNACNQKNNRDPVMTLDEDAVRDAVDSLQGQRLAGPAGGADSRVTKYEHRLQEVYNFDRREIAVLCVLLLRGAQTPGELRGRAERMYRFEALEDVVATLDRLSQREPPLVAVLPRQPGTKESRYMHLFSGDAPPVEAVHARAFGSSSMDDDRVGRLESEVAELRREIGEMKEQLAAFRRQFE